MEILSFILTLWITAGTFSMFIFALHHDKTDQVRKVQRSFPYLTKEYIVKLLTIMHILLIPVTLWFWPKFIYELYKD